MYRGMAVAMKRRRRLSQYAKWTEMSCEHYSIWKGVLYIIDKALYLS